eukprot:1298149-Prymnesium_polylepis.2
MCNRGCVICHEHRSSNCSTHPLAGEPTWQRVERAIPVMRYSQGNKQASGNNCKWSGQLNLLPHCADVLASITCLIGLALWGSHVLAILARERRADLHGLEERQRGRDLLRPCRRLHRQRLPAPSGLCDEPDGNRQW